MYPRRSHRHKQVLKLAFQVLDALRALDVLNALPPCRLGLDALVEVEPRHHIAQYEAPRAATEDHPEEHRGVVPEVGHTAIPARWLVFALSKPPMTATTQATIRGTSFSSQRLNFIVYHFLTRMHPAQKLADPHIGKALIQIVALFC